MSFEVREYLRHILLAADYLIRESSGMSTEAFVSDETLGRAFVRSREIFGKRRRNS
jgi:uncharacterized protein with HEPN domain